MKQHRMPLVAVPLTLHVFLFLVKKIKGFYCETTQTFGMRHLPQKRFDTTREP